MKESIILAIGVILIITGAITHWLIGIVGSILLLVFFLLIPLLQTNAQLNKDREKQEMKNRIRNLRN